MIAGVLLVHGAWHGPWCWDGVAERLRRRGHRVEAVRLRGHHRPPGRIWHRVHHYVEDVGVAAARFAEPPVLVGHSLGGLVEAEVFSGMGHDLMLDQGWPQVADRIGTWVPGLPPASSRLLGRRTR